MMKKNDFALQQEACDAERLSLGAPERLRGVTLSEPSGKASSAQMWANLWADYFKENRALTAQNEKLQREVQELRARVASLEKLSSTTSSSN